MDESREEEADDRPPFQMNWQVVVIVVVTGLALAVPMAGLALFAAGFFPAKPKPVAADPGNLRVALEQTAASALAPKLLEETRAVVTIPAGNERDAKVKTLRETVAKLGGSVVEFEAGKRFLVSAPAGGFAATQRALGVTEILESPGAGGDFFEVRFP